jgi:phosphoribosylglycinamide formyltransferase-1
MVRIAVFASGSGTNAENIINYFESNKQIKVVYVLTNNKNAGVIERAERLKIYLKVFSKKELFSSEFANFLRQEVDFIVLAGFLLKIPTDMIRFFPNKIINIHPALLPKYGGKGMYGMYVHNAVVANKEKESGITIHYVNENYDEGAIIFQKSVSVLPTDTPDDVAAKIHILEQKYFPKIIEETIIKNF